MTTTTAKTKKQTAGNNAFLADVKHLFNKPMFAKATAMVNGPAEPEAGEAEFRAYLLENVTSNEDHVNGLGTGKRYY